MSYSMARTVPEEDNENYITEKEAKEMVNGFNAHLKTLALQVEELEKLNLNLKTKLQREVSRNQHFRESIWAEKEKISDLDEEIKKKNSELVKTENRIDEEFKGLQDKRSLDVSQDWEQAEELLEYLSLLERTSIVFHTTNELISKRLDDKRNHLNSDAVCVHCRQSYVRALNNSRSCSYHPGKLKYFSCRGCGADPYFECCLKCQSCSKGCKVSHHTS